MDFVNFHIAYLLTKHECVTIPDFGAFVASKVNDDKSKKRRFISPPGRYSLIFNPEFIQDDGLLAGSIAKEKNISHEEALHLIDDYVDELVSNLIKGKTIAFPWIGEICLSDDRKILFTPAKNPSCNASVCGLVNVSFPYLSEISKNKSAIQRKKIHKWPLFYVVLAGFVALLVLLIYFLIFKVFGENLLSFPV